MELLNKIEGVGIPNGYHRIVITVINKSSNRQYKAFAYVKHRKNIDIIQYELNDEYMHDPRYILAQNR